MIMVKNNFSKEEIIELLQSDGRRVFETADKVRKRFVGDAVHLRGLIEFSNICKRNCAYCGLRASNRNIERYRLSEDEIVRFAKNGAELGYKTIVLQSGEDDYYTKDRMCRIIERIKSFDVALTLSIGERTYDEYKAFKTAGADRYLMRIETTDKTLYKKLHPKMDYEKRVECLYNLRGLSYEVGTGCLVGLPGQTIESLADDILFFKELNADMIGVGPFIPHPDTPLRGNLNPKNFDMALKVMAITRVILRDINIPATTAMETINPNGRIIALQSGANVVMPNITEVSYRSKYTIYPNKICINDEPSKCRGCISRKIRSIGRTVAEGKGFRADNEFNK